MKEKSNATINQAPPILVNFQLDAQRQQTIFPMDAIVDNICNTSSTTTTTNFPTLPPETVPDSATMTTPPFPDVLVKLENSQEAVPFPTVAANNANTDNVLETAVFEKAHELNRGSSDRLKAPADPFEPNNLLHGTDSSTQAIEPLPTLSDIPSKIPRTTTTGNKALDRAQADIVRGYRQILPRDPSIFTCPSCQKEYLRSAVLTRNGRLPYECEACQMRYKCTLCTRHFRKKADLVAHMRRHTKLQFKCDVCHKEFATRSYFEFHKDTHRTFNFPVAPS